MTRQQQYLRQAINDIAEVQRQDPQVQEKYLSYCKRLAALVRACGLCQAMAFVEERARPEGSADGRAYDLIKQHAAAVMGVPSDRLMESLLGCQSLQEYMSLSRSFLAGWAYHRRLAAARLETAAEGGEDTDDDASSS